MIKCSVECTAMVFESSIDKMTGDCSLQTTKKHDERVFTANRGSYWADTGRQAIIVDHLRSGVIGPAYIAYFRSCLYVCQTITFESLDV